MAGFGYLSANWKVVGMCGSEQRTNGNMPLFKKEGEEEKKKQ